ncbi:MAG TPA: AraC family transcriptional regulator [Kofleriaceae bacterium]|nr:AraC family transcriptional regulator [Kofleriaceae bacterium]
MESYTLPAVHALHLVQLCGRWRVTPEQLLAGTGLDAGGLAAPGRRLPLATVIGLVERARTLTGEPALGFHLGLQMRISWHGFVGFAAMASSTVRDALEIAARFAPTRTNALALRLEVIEKTAALVIEERAPLGAAQDAIVLALVTGIWQIGNALCGRVLAGSVDLAFDEPAYYARFKNMAPANLRFAQPQHRMIFDASILALPIAERDPVAEQIAREQCERELAELGVADPLAQVRALLPSDAGFRTLDQVAERMHVSVRTLKRRLAEHDTSFSALLDEARRDRATHLLRAGELGVDEIGARLGYSDPANFARAFRRWTGISPRAFRKKQ